MLCSSGGNSCAHVDYDHSQNIHTLEGPLNALPEMFASSLPNSLLDIGCGTGTWLRAALDYGVGEVMGVDGVRLPQDQLLIPSACIHLMDLRTSINLNRTFSVVFCFEVAEHLEIQYAGVLLDTLTRHSDHIFFSAACPNQMGQHHVNCQWPGWWQEKFNERGYVCDDAIRWQLWDQRKIEPWYRQNMFLAKKDTLLAGTERRLSAVIHPDMLPYVKPAGEVWRNETAIVNGGLPISWYLRTSMRALSAKISRRLRD
jgi:hypothetical protein